MRTGRRCGTRTRSGRNGQTAPFPGSIRQRLSKLDNKTGVDAGGPVIGNSRNYAGAGLHAPN